MTRIELAQPNRLRTCASLALINGLLMTGSALAGNEHRADLKAMSFTTQNVYNQVINVVSTNNTRWDKIEPGTVSFGAHIMIDTRDYVFAHGWVDAAGIILGPCGEAACMGKPLLWLARPRTKDYENQMAVTFPTSKIPVSSAGGIASVHHGDEIIARCNDGPLGKERTFDYLMQATFAADTSQRMSRSEEGGGGGGALPATWINEADYSLTKSFEVKVRCKPFEPATSTSHEDPNPDPHRTKVGATDIDLFLTTYAIPAGSQSGPRGTECKPLKVTTRIETDKAGPKNVMLWRQVNGGPITSEGKQMHAAALASGKFGDDWDKFEHFTQTTTVQYKAEVIGGTFAPSTPWKSITIHCNGDYAAPQTNANPDNRGKPLPPAIVTPRPPACGASAAKVRGSAPCVKTAQVPDKRKEAAEQRRKAAQEAELRRREAALKSAELQRPHHLGRLGGPGRFGGGGRPMMRGGFVMSPGLILK